MIQFNLLPDVKIQLIRIQRIKHIVTFFSSVISIAVLTVFIALFVYVNFIQTSHINDLNSKIASSSTQLSKNTNLNKILTIQNQLKTLPLLESQTPVTSRLLGYLTQLTPVSVSISSLSVDFTTDTMSISGGAQSLKSVNEYIDSIKFATYKTTQDETAVNAFSSVVLSSFGYSSSGSNSSQPASYTVNFSFDPTIFSNATKVTLLVPNKITTRSILGQPTNLFVQRSKSINGSSSNGK